MLASGTRLETPRRGANGSGAHYAFLSVKDDDKPATIHVARRLRALGFDILATKGTAAAIERASIAVEVVKKVGDGSPHVVDAIRGGAIAMVVNTAGGAKEVRDSFSLRRQTLLANIPYFTTIAAALAACDALEAAQAEPVAPVQALQEWGKEWTKGA
jgi:carbamoyl-phosphate synthase large subunit